MEQTISPDLVWWITVVDLPALAGLFLLMWRTRQELYKAMNHTQTLLEHRSEQMREALNSFKLEVAKSYVSQTSLGHLEARIVENLLRIEAKLEATTLKAEALKAKSEHD